ncbi:MAG TPA: hypothetical protein VMV45_04355 [Casimicrobiaceae bacterium]|nr:hypothetical protein [Casimicrobiaceae bacterium]
MTTQGRSNLIAIVSTALVSSTLSVLAHATSIDVMVGDMDGFGFGCPNVAPAGTCIWPGPGTAGSFYDGRSPAEAAATNGAQITDMYSAIFPQFGANNFTQADVLLTFTGTLVSGTVDVASGDRQLPQGGPIGFTINGFDEVFATNQGFQGSGIDTYVLSAAELAAANAAGAVIPALRPLLPGRPGRVRLVSADRRDLLERPASAAGSPRADDSASCRHRDCARLATTRAASPCQRARPTAVTTSIDARVRRGAIGARPPPSQ